MKISKALRNAWKVYTASIGQTAAFLAVEGCLVLICLAPLLFLTKKDLWWAAALCPVLWILLRLPTRMNAARVMRGALRGGSLADAGLVDMGNYGEKLVCGLKRTFFLILWSAPLIVLLIIGWNNFSGNTDSFTVLRKVREMGGGNQMRGFALIAGMVAAAVLIQVCGCAFHCGARHAWAGGRKDIVQGHHGKVFLCGVISALCLLPILIAVGISIGRYVPVFTNLNGLLTGSVKLPSTRTTEIILAVGAVLTLPLLPLRSLIPAAYVDGLDGADEPETAEVSEAPDEMKAAEKA